jgi:hypothetical protein
MSTPREPSHIGAGNAREAYWDRYYAAQVDGRRPLPSPFAAFVCGEYRTVRDVRQAKVTGQHYRRFIDPAAFQLRAAQHAFSVQYAVEGFGFAKYEQDDAYVARCLLVRDAG